MKLRVRDNSIRLRLTQTEVEQVRQDRFVRGRVPLAGNSHFDYVLESSPGGAAPEVTLSGSELTVSIPESRVMDWSNSAEVSISAEQLLDGGRHLSILVEKDFACLAPREDEDEADMYPHPMAGKESC